MTKTKPTVSNKDVALQTAMMLFLTKGYHVTSMDDIVKASKVSKTNIYYHFKSKEELLIAMVDQLTARYERQILSVAAQEDLTIAVRLERIVNMLTTNQSSMDVLGGCPFLTLYMQTSTESEQVRSQIKQFFDRQLHALERLLEAGVRNQELRSDLQVQPTAALMLTSIEGALFIAKACDNPRILQDLLQGLLALLK
ncbi:AcrR family transcriptional regulator [Paenibacillus phyllosphaerae]|uniref:AcrR family transcriptional regulator n=1 Tax=Paenibacillus phyllosphaerae TaxID=274593 RepID=A0A7W5FRF4_9BACL|nr:TetR/AcrR family transcriptional regulator [Paenibacillus phyllosphaerae]MBB3114476.1 AcrR family transcriptional regulator [Paenibacillus phyllosphaerae]